MTTVKQAAENREHVNFKVCFFEEKVLGKKETPAFKIGMKCTDDHDQELDGWFTTVIWGTPKARPFAQKFFAALDKKADAYYLDGEWHYDAEALKWAKGRVQLQLNGSGWPEAAQWISEKTEKKNDQKSTKVVDDDLPF